MEIHLFFRHVKIVGSLSDLEQDKSPSDLEKDEVFSLIKYIL